MNTNKNNNYNNSYEQQQDNQLHKSRFLFQQIIEDNQPTQQQIIQRAQQLQIHDLNMARQSLTKQMQSYWRPYSNRKSDIYYINLKQKKAYIDHPVDMETQLLYAKKYKKVIPKFKAYELEMVSGSLGLVEQQINKYNYNEMMKTQLSQQNITTQLNIVYEESEQSLASSKKRYQSSKQQQYSQNQSQQQDYIENLQKQSIKNIIGQKYHQATNKNMIRLNRKQTVARFQQIDEINLSSSKQQQQSQQVYLSPQCQSMLLSYEQDLIESHQKQLLLYKQKKQQNYIKKTNIYKNQYKKQYERYKNRLQEQYQHELQQKNQSNLMKQVNKIKNNYQQKVYIFENNLHRQYDIIVQLNQINTKKMSFIQNIQYKMENTIAIKKHNRIIEQTANFNNYFNIHTKIVQLTNEAQKKYNNALNRVLNELLINKNDYNINNAMANPLSGMYSNILKKQFNAIDSLILSSQVNKQTRKRSRSIFNQSKTQMNKMLQSQKQIILRRKQNKQNFMDYANNNQQNAIKYSKNIEEQIEKDKENVQIYKKNRARIFSQKVQPIQSIKKQQQNIKQIHSSIKKQEQNKNNSVLKIMTVNEQRRQCRNDRKSMYLRMMKRII